MSLTDPGKFINTATAMSAAEPAAFLPAGDVRLAPDARPVESAGVDAWPAQQLRPYDPFDDPCNYLG